jgi:hypothetical protein
VWGLPGQTLDHWNRNFLETTALELYCHHYTFEILPNSPAGLPEYQERFQIKPVVVYAWNKVIKGLTINNITQQDLDRLAVITYAPTSCYSMDQASWFTGMMKNAIYRAHTNTVHQNPSLYVQQWEKLQPIVDYLYRLFLKNKIMPGFNNAYLDHEFIGDISYQIEETINEIYSQ